MRLLANPLVIILLVASALLAATGEGASFVIIAGIVLLSVLLDFAQENQTQNAVDALRRQVALRADARRDGAEASLPVTQLVPGDIVRLTAADMVPADGVLLSSRDFFVKQALLTGESFSIEKHAAEHGDSITVLFGAGGPRRRNCSTVGPLRAKMGIFWQHFESCISTPRLRTGNYLNSTGVAKLNRSKVLTTV